MYWWSHSRLACDVIWCLPERGHTTAQPTVAAFRTDSAVLWETSLRVTGYVPGKFSSLRQVFGGTRYRSCVSRQKTDRQTDGRKDRQTGGRTDRQADRHVLCWAAAVTSHRVASAYDLPQLPAQTAVDTSCGARFMLWLNWLLETTKRHVTSHYVTANPFPRILIDQR